MFDEFMEFLYSRAIYESNYIIICYIGIGFFFADYYSKSFVWNHAFKNI